MRLSYLPKIPDQLKNFVKSNPLNVGVLFSGGPAPGGHNVIAGLFAAIQEINNASRLFGFIGGSDGCIKGVVKELVEKEVKAYLNQGGFDLLGTGRTKIETNEQMASVLAVCQKLNLQGLVIIGGDDSNTNAAYLAEYFLKEKSSICVIGIPKTIDGDLRSKEIEMSFGFDTACKTYAEIIGNICRDAISTKKYYHLIKLMGRSASHIPLECALQTHPNLTFIGEEKKTLVQIVEEIADLIEKRYQAKKEYGVILFPEGIVEWTPGMLEKFQEDLLEKDSHGNPSLASVPVEELLISLVKERLSKRDFSGSFAWQKHFLGYEGRCAFPSNFDANYAYSLGKLAALGIQSQKTGVICAISHLKEPISSWTVSFVPLASLLHEEMRNGELKRVIRKTFVDLHGKPFQSFAHLKDSWKIDDHYRYPGPIQFEGSPELTDSVPMTLSLLQ